MNDTNTREDRLTLPDFNSKETAHVATYWCESLFETLNFPSSRVAPSIISKAAYQLIPKGALERPSISQVCEWVKMSWSNVNEQTVVKSFLKCGISNTLDGSEDHFLYIDDDDDEQEDEDIDEREDSDNSVMDFAGF